VSRLDVLGMMDVLKVPGLLFVANELCCLKLGQRDLETEAAHRGLFGRPRSKWRKSSLGASFAASSVLSSYNLVWEVWSRPSALVRVLGLLLG
jgi:hypothetical protein